MNVASRRPASGNQPDIAAAITARGATGPVLVVADEEAIAREAVDWAASLAAAGLVHRVVLAGVDVAAAAGGLGAAVVVAAGSAAARAAARDVATALSLPLVEWPDHS